MVPLLSAALAAILGLSPLPGGGWLGVILEDTAERPTIAEVIPGSPADRAGLRAGDVVAAVGGVPTPRVEALVRALSGCKAGDKVRLRLRRGSAAREVTVELAARPAGLPAPPAPRVASRPAPGPASRPAGAEPDSPRPAPAPRAFVGVAIDEEGESLRVDEVIAGGPAAAAGVRAGDLLLRLGEQRLQSVDDLQRALAAARPGQTVDLHLQRGRGDRARTRTVRLKLAALPGEAASSPRSRPTQASKVRTPEAVSWPVDHAAARAEARRLGRPLLVVFGASWCPSCDALRKAMRDSAVATVLRRYSVVWLDTDKEGRLADKYGVQRIPHLVIEGPTGDVRASLAGFRPAAGLAALLTRHAGRRRVAGSGASDGAAPREPSRGQPGDPARARDRG